jgi:hypothetical protein
MMDAQLVDRWGPRYADVVPRATHALPRPLLLTAVALPYGSTTDTGDHYQSTSPPYSMQRARWTFVLGGFRRCCVSPQSDAALVAEGAAKRGQRYRLCPFPEPWDETTHVWAARHTSPYEGRRVAPLTVSAIGVEGLSLAVDDSRLTLEASTQGGACERTDPNTVVCHRRSAGVVRSLGCL